VTPPANHYEVLGVAPDAGAAEVHRAYLAMARRHHPDRDGGDAARMRKVNEAWATLGDPARRHQYDLVLRRPAARPGPGWVAGTDGMPPRPSPVDDPTDLYDDQPVRITIQLPKWLSMLPPGLFVAALVLFAGGALFGPAFLALGILALVSSLLLFVASPFVALYASRRVNR
jgi:DnaJ-like protein